ncbi:CAP domain-containing protein [Rubrivirga sp.]|uniref:CAP domain-containing protein n=1 Tax=Rubrivirga sp. TaxID=1885344 RepID=UPI003C710566
MFARTLGLAVSLMLLVACDTVGVDTRPLPDADLDAWDAEMLAAVNEARAQGGVCGTERMAPSEPLIWDVRLERAAARHSRDMSRHGYIGHVDSRGRGIGERVREAGYDWSVVAENIARYRESIDEVVEDWLESPGHCVNILNPVLMEMGSANVDGNWTQVFGVPR